MSRTGTAFAIPLNSNEDDDHTTLSSSSSMKAKAQRIDMKDTGSAPHGGYIGLADSSLNPSLQLRSKLIASGFEEVEVDAAIEEMWNRQLPYDDFEAVSSFIWSQRESIQHLPVPALAEISITTTNHSEPSSKGSDFATGSGSSSAGDRQERKKSTGRHASHSLALASKLDLVADYENLTDAALALSEWATKAAKQAELQEFCAATTSKALLTVVRRTVADCPDQSKFEESALPAILHLIGSVLLQLGVQPRHISEIRQNLETVLKQAREASILKGDEKDSFATNASQMIVSRISDAVDRLCSGIESARRLENGIELRTRSMEKEKNIIDLITKRDKQKSAVERSSAALGAALVSVETPSDGSDGSDHMNTAKKQVIKDLLGENGIESLAQSKKAHEALRKEIVQTKSEASAKSQELESSLETYRAERVSVADKIEALRRALKELEEEDAALSGKIEDTQQQLAELSEKRDQDVECLKQKLSLVSPEIGFEKKVGELADGLKVYVDSLDNAILARAPQASESSHPLDDPIDDIEQKMGTYLLKAKTYFQAEAECVQFLRRRVETLEKEALQLETELEQCNSLGLTANVKQISDALEVKRANAKDDMTVIDGLCSEDKRMNEDLVKRLEQFASARCGDHKKLDLSQLHTKVLRDVATAVSVIGLEDDDRLQSYMSKDDDTRSTYVLSDAHGEDTDSATTSHSEVASPTSAPNTGGDELASKLTWAKPNGQAQKKQSKSLTEIQKEELSCK